MKKRIVAYFKDLNFKVFIYLLPALIIFLVYFVSPIPVSVYYSFFRMTGIGKQIFVGLRNWAILLQDSIFWQALMNNLKFVVLAITGQLTISLLLAVLVTSKTRLSDFLKTVYFIPLLTSSVAVATLWSFIYHPTFGLLNAFLEKLGLDFLILDWLGSSKSALYAVIAAINWRFIPFYMILFIAAIVGIPKRLYEAAEIDGASAFQSFWYITLPQLKNTIINATVLILVGSLKYFDIVFTMTQGGPNHSSELLATYMYLKTFFDFRMGYGSAIAVSLFILAFVTSFVLLKLTKKDIRN